jgi:glucose-6-phosphate isomerase
MPRATDLLTRWPSLDAAAKRDRLLNTFHLFAGPLSDIVDRERAAAGHAAERLWRRDPSLWTNDPAVQRKIADRLGWLTSPALMAEAIPRVQAFAQSIKSDGFSDVVLLGMGGSSLAPEVMRGILGVQPGWPQLHMLDSTDPAAVRAVSPPLDRTLFILASKSGTTIEPNSLAEHFRERLVDAGVQRWASHFIAITDGGTELDRRARAEGFREVFVNPSDIGGRYSALSFFGLVPAALMGQDIAGLVGWALAMLAASENDTGGSLRDPSTALGLAIASAARAGRDKLTLVVPHAFEPFGLWVEQLVEESTGKQGAGVVPIAGETPAAPADYPSDRFFVTIAVGDPAGPMTPDLNGAALESVNAPVMALDLAEPLALGAEFVRWEIATAIAGALLHIDPFDEPNVQQAKDATRGLLERYQSEGRLPVPPPDRTTPDGVTMTLSTAARKALNKQPAEAFLTLIGPRDYFALLAYLGPDPALADALSAFRLGVRAHTRAATMFGYGPRYLHSTGQLHKGGPNTGVFVLITATPASDLPIPRQAYSFGTLELAQALGDFASLDATGRRAVHVHLPSPDARLLRAVAKDFLR